MKKKHLLISMFMLFAATTAWADVEINETNFPDAKFRQWVLSQNYGRDGMLKENEIAGITNINVTHNGDIKSLKGIEFFTALTKLNCSVNNLTELDISKNIELLNLECYGNYLTSLDVSKNTALETLDCFSNYLTSLDLSQNKALIVLYCGSNKLASLDVTKNTELGKLDCNNIQLTTLDVSKNTKLIGLNCSENLLTELDLSKNKKLESLTIYQNQIKGEAMDRLVKSLPDRSFLYDYGESYLGGIDVIGYMNEQNEMTKLQVAAAKAKGWIPYYEYIDPVEGSFWRKYDGSGTAIVSAKINAENFPDENFRKWLLRQWYGDDGVLTNVEIANITKIDVHSDWSEQIQSLKGIELLKALTYLDCESNYLKGLDVSQNTKLEYLNSSFNYSLGTLNVSKNTSLTELHCERNQLYDLDVSKNTALRELYCDNNYLRTLDVSNNNALTLLSCAGNRLTKLDVTNNNELNEIICYNNRIKDELMDALIESLPKVNKGTMKVIYHEDEQNIISVTQVAAAKEKGWTPYYSALTYNEEFDYYEYDWVEYTGDESDSDGIESPLTEMNEGAVFNLTGQRVSKPAKGLYIVNGKKILNK